jgi:hypothetical protein
MKLIVSLGLSVMTAAAQPEFVGYSLAGSFATFVLRDGAHGPTRWLRAGEDFGGITVVAFRPLEEQLAVRLADGEAALLPLRPASTSAEAPGAEKALLIARQEAGRRDGWSTALRLQAAPLEGGAWRVLVFPTAPGKTEGRMVVIGADGGVRDYGPI